MTTGPGFYSSWVVGVGSDHGLWLKYNNDGDIDPKSNQTSWGGSLRYEPFALHIQNGKGIDIFAIDANNGHLKMKYSAKDKLVGKDDGWYDLGGVCAGSPVAVNYNKDKDYHSVAVVGMNGDVYECYYQGNWTWKKLDVDANRTPAFQPEKIFMSSNQDDRIDLVGVAVTNDLYHRFWTQTNGWSRWVSVGRNAVAGRPYCYTNGSGRVDIVAKDATDFKLYHTACDNGVWLGWDKVADTQVTYDVAGCPFPRGNRFDLAYVDNNGATNHSFCTTSAGKLGTWYDKPENFGGVASSTPKIALRNISGSDGIAADIFVRGMDSAFYRIGYASSTGYTSWQKYGGTYVQKPC